MGVVIDSSVFIASERGTFDLPAKLAQRAGEDAALSAITAAIVGVVLNLAVWFALHVFFPATGTIDWFAILLCIAAFVAMTRYKVDIISVVIGAGVLGLLYKSLHGFS